MFDNDNPYAPNNASAMFAAEDERVGFIRRTYAHLFGAVMALIAFEVALFQLVPAATMQGMVATMTAGYGWLIVLGAFMVVGMIARSWANNSTSVAMQYLGLGLYIVAEGIILLPLLYIAMRFAGPDLPMKAAAITGLCFTGLTGFVMFTRVDLSGWGSFLWVAGLAMMGILLAGLLFGFDLGLYFSGAMIALACGYILYDTSNVLHHYRTTQHVAASLALFSSVATLFWYVLRIMMAFSGRD
ncbi:MAG: Bax inhibitor-1 family protein [Planctomycetota bacterium]